MHQKAGKRAEKALSGTDKGTLKAMKWVDKLAKTLTPKITSDTIWRS